MAPALLDRLLGREAPAAAPADVPAEPAPRGSEAAAQALHAALAEKVLRAWAQNRQQVLVPLTLNLAREAPERRRLVVLAMAAALAAGGAPAEAARTRLSAALIRIGGGAEIAAAEAALADPPHLLALLREVEAVGLGAHAFAAAAQVLDRRIAAERAFLDWLAAFLALPPSLLAGIARRYRR